MVMKSIDVLMVIFVGNEMHQKFVTLRMVNHQLDEAIHKPRAKIILVSGGFPWTTYFLQYYCVLEHGSDS
jgi:ABC-type thiamine transport system ATPase subunit